MEALIRACLPISSLLTEQLISCVESCRAKGLGQICDGLKDTCRPKQLACVFQSESFEGVKINNLN